MSRKVFAIESDPVPTDLSDTESDDEQGLNGFSFVSFALETTSTAHDFPTNWPKAADVSDRLREKLKENLSKCFGIETPDEDEDSDAHINRKPRKIQRHLLYTGEQVEDDPLGLAYYTMSYVASFHSSDDEYVALHSHKNAPTISRPNRRQLL